MVSVTRILTFAGLACHLTAAAPSVYHAIQQRDSNVQYDAFYQEVIHIVAMTSTVYVAAPSSTPAPEQAPAEAAQEEEDEEEVEEVEVEESKPAAAPQAKAATSGGGMSGDASFYDPGMGSCGISSSGSEYVVALSISIMQEHGGNPNNNPMCGKEIVVSYKGKSVTATVVDTCPGCPSKGDIDLSPACFEKLAHKDLGKIPVSWSYA